MKLIIGLGNPGKEYARTRHNIGWMAVDEVARLLEAAPFQAKKAFKAEIAEAHIGKEKVLLVHPLTFMNASGEAVAAIKSFYHCEDGDILVIQDEMDYVFGKMAFSVKGGPAGHNGIESIQQSLGTKDLARLRIGISRPTPPITPEDYVLQRFSKEEGSLLVKIIVKAGQAARDWIEQGIDKASNTWNGK